MACNCFDRVDKELNRKFRVVLERNLLRGIPRAVIMMASSKKRVFLEATFCPFCGTKYDDTALLEEEAHDGDYVA